MEPAENNLSFVSNTALSQKIIESQIPSLLGNNHGPFFHIYVDMNLCSLFDINLKDLTNGEKVKKAFRAKINKCVSKEQEKDKIHFSIAYELMKNLYSRNVLFSQLKFEPNYKLLFYALK